MPDLFIGSIDSGAANNGGLKTQAIKFKFRGANYDEQMSAAKMLAACMRDSDVIPIEHAVQMTMQLDGYDPAQAVEELFNDTSELTSMDGVIYTATEEAVTLLRDLVRCGEYLFEFLVGLALVAEWPKKAEPA